MLVATSGTKSVAFLLKDKQTLKDKYTLAMYG